MANRQKPLRTVPEFTSHKDRINAELKAQGVSRLGLMKYATRYLPHVIHPNEHIQGIVYGYNDQGSVALIATDFRVIYLDKKPLFVNEDEITYEVVTGVNTSSTLFGTTITLHTRIKDYTVHTLNKKCAYNFVEFIEAHRLEHNIEELRR